MATIPRNGNPIAVAKKPNVAGHNALPASCPK